MPPFIGWEMHCDMIEGQQMSKEWDDMAEGGENVVELEAWLEWEMRPIKFQLQLEICYQVADVRGQKKIKLIYLDLTAAHSPLML